MTDIPSHGYLLGHSGSCHGKADFQDCEWTLPYRVIVCSENHNCHFFYICVMCVELVYL